MTELHSTDPETLQELIPTVIDLLRNRKKIALTGEMGAGKTTFVAAFCAFLKVEQHPSSPTYSLVNEYSYPKSDGTKGIIRHLDLYRLQKPEEAFDFGIEDMLYDPHYCLIEWPQIIESLLPEDTVSINIHITGATNRIITIN